MSMNNIKKLLVALITVMAFGMMSFVADCYTAWLADFEAATIQYGANRERCAASFVPGIPPPLTYDMCINEAEAVYDAAINTAADAYEACLDAP